MAERQLAATSAAIGVARGGYSPLISLSGSAGYQGSSFEHLFPAPNEVRALVAAAIAPLFDGGKVTAQSAQSSAEQSAVQILGRRPDASVVLLKTAGGDWRSAGD